MFTLAVEAVMHGVYPSGGGRDTGGLVYAWSLGGEAEMRKLWLRTC